MSTLARYQAFALDAAGNVLPSPTVTVVAESSGANAALFSDRAGTVSMSNPFTGQSDGLIAFHTGGGAYKITVVSGSSTREFRYVGIGTSSETDTPVAVAYLVAANNLSDLASIATAKTNLGLATVATTGVYSDLTGRPTFGNVIGFNVNVASGVPVLNASGQYEAFDGQPIANIGGGLTGACRVGTVITAVLTGGGSAANNAGVAGSTLGAVTYGLVGGFCGPVLQSFYEGFILPGSWMNISGRGVGPSYGTTWGVWVRYA